jgi:hypothetical protein
MLVTSGAHVTNYLKEIALLFDFETLLVLPVQGLLGKG